MADNAYTTRRALLGMGAAAAIGTPLRAFADPLQVSTTVPVKVEKDVVVGRGGDAELHCDVYRPPAGSEKHMALLHLHGGGFSRGSKDTLSSKLAPITARGYLSVAAANTLSGVGEMAGAAAEVENGPPRVRARRGSVRRSTHSDGGPWS